MLRRTIEITRDCRLEPPRDPQDGVAVLVVNTYEVGSIEPEPDYTYLDAQDVRALRAALYEAIE